MTFLLAGGASRQIALSLMLTVLGSAVVPAAPIEQNQQPQSEPAQTKPEVPKTIDASGPAAPVNPDTYLIGPEDVLQVRVWKEPELSGGVVVRPDGKITLALVGDVQAAGLTPRQVTANVTQALSRILNKPEVMVSVISVQSKRYYVSGNVNHSGPVPLVTPTTVLQALSQAGLREWAKKGKIVIMRGTERLKFNYNDVIKGKKLAQNIELKDGDHIFVP